MMQMNKLYDEIYHKYKYDVFRLIYSYTLNREDANDIFQRVFLKLYLQIKKFLNSDDNVKRWLFRVASNECKNHLKSFWISKRTLVDDISNLDRINNKDNSIIESLKHISSLYRIPLFLYYYEGYDINEISKIMGLSISNVKQRLKRGREKLKGELEDKYE